MAARSHAHPGAAVRISWQPASIGAGTESGIGWSAMTSTRWIEYLFFLAIVVALALPVGLYLARVAQRRRTFLDPLLRPIESMLYRLLGVRPQEEMTAGVYITCFLL